MSMFRRSVDSVVSSEASASAVAPAGDSRTKEAKKQKLLRVVLVIMLVAIVSLTIAIIVVNLTKNSGPEPGSDDSDDSNNIQIDRMAKIREYIRLLSVDDAVVYLDEQIKKYEGTEYDFDVKLMKAYVYINDSKIAEAVGVLDGIDGSSLGDFDKMSLYSAYAATYSGDDEKERYYLDLKNDIYANYQGGGEGGE